MNIIKGDLFKPHIEGITDIEYPDAICITTNGFVKANGKCVMGRGSAKELVDRFPDTDLILGEKILENGNIVQVFFGKVIAFPVKPIDDIFNGNNSVEHMKSKFKIAQRIPGWACKADIKIIKRSAKQLVKRMENCNATKTRMWSWRIRMERC